MGSNRNLNPKADSTEAQSMAELKQYAVYIAAIIILALAGFFWMALLAKSFSYR